MILRLALALALLPCVGLADIVEAKGAQLRMLDKMSGVVSDYDVARGQTQAKGRLSVRLDDCRYPSDQPNAEAYAHLTITDAGGTASTAQVFSGWMIASSPGLSALDHPRYDVWVLNCDVPAAAAAPGATATGNGSGG